MKTHRTITSDMFIDEHGIVHKTILEGYHVDINAVKEADIATQKITGGKRVLVLYDLGPHFTITPDATTYANEDIINKQYIAIAIVSDKLAVKITTDYFSKTLKTPIHLFSNKKDAIEWLLTFKKKGAK